MEAEHFEIDKMHAAHRQLNMAIRLHFEGDDPVAVLALTGGATRIFADLIEHRNLERSWDRRAREVVGLSKAEYFRALRDPTNFLKHADDDPDEVLHWSVEDTEALMITAVMNAVELDDLSPTSVVYQFWYVAKHRHIFSPTFEAGNRATDIFPGIQQMSVAEQRAAGLRRLYKFQADLAADPNLDRLMP